MNHGSLFSGIGGFDLAAEWMGWENIFHCEWNEFGRKVLTYYWPKAQSYEDITKTDFNIYRGRIDILSGGFPCQPYSGAGKRLGKEDDRHLWPEMLRAIREIQPSFVVAENVLGLVNWNEGLVFHEVQADLEVEGYEVQPFVLPACAVNGQHRRDRVWFIAYSNKVPRQPMGERKNEDKQQREKKVWCENRELFHMVFNGSMVDVRNERGQDVISEPALVCDIDGLSERLDGTTFQGWCNESNGAYGNAIVPQLAHEIYKAIQINN